MTLAHSSSSFIKASCLKMARTCMSAQPRTLAPLHRAGISNTFGIFMETPVAYVVSCAVASHRTWSPVHDNFRRRAGTAANFCRNAHRATSQTTLCHHRSLFQFCTRLPRALASLASLAVDAWAIAEYDAASPKGAALHNVIAFSLFSQYTTGGKRLSWVLEIVTTPAKSKSCCGRTKSNPCPLWSYQL